MLFDSLPFPAIAGMEEELRTEFAMSGSAAPARTRRASASEGLAEIVAQMANGSQEAMGRLYDATSPLINGMLLRILEHPQDAEEVLLDVYMKAWKNAAAYSEKRGSVQAWLVITARNAAIDRIRQHRAMPKTVHIEPESGADIESPDASPETQTAAEQRRRKVQEVLNELPRDQREAIDLAFFAGLTHAELAEHLGEPLGTIKSRIRMGLLRLRSLLEFAEAI